MFSLTTRDHKRQVFFSSEFLRPREPERVLHCAIVWLWCSRAALRRSELQIPFFERMHRLRLARRSGSASIKQSQPTPSATHDFCSQQRVRGWFCFFRLVYLILLLRIKYMPSHTFYDQISLASERSLRSVNGQISSAFGWVHLELSHIVHTLCVHISSHERTSKCSRTWQYDLLDNSKGASLSFQTCI